MQPFRYLDTDNLDAALAAMAAHPDAGFVAGGTALVDLMKLGVQTPRLLIDINKLPLTEIEPGEDSVTIGAMVRNAELARHSHIREHYPLVVQALLSGASPQLRNAATLGGNLMQRTRCSYFRDIHSPCNKRAPGTGCSARHGRHRRHAILGSSEHCIAAHPSDLAVALSALDAVIHTRGPADERRLRVDDFYLLPGHHPQHETLLKREELIVAVEIPRLSFAARSLYRKVRDRASYDFALVSVAAALDLDAEDVIRDARLALGGVAPKPWRARAGEAVLIGSKAGADTFRAAADAVLEDAVPHPGNRFKVELSRRLIVRTLTELKEKGVRT